MAELEKLFDGAKKSILDRMNDWLNGNVNDVKVKTKSKKLDLTAKVTYGSLTYAFLNKYRQESNLRQLMLGKMNDFIQLISDLKRDAFTMGYHEEYVFENLTLVLYERYEKGGAKLQSTAVGNIDHFNTIVKDVFLAHGYDGEYSKGTPVFKKSDFVKLLNLRICPYCGRAFIYGVQRVGSKTVVKPQIDHFLPKSKYPFLALSFMNLIPSCQTCNMKDCKGDNDPIANYIVPVKYMIQYPYEFDTSKVTFEYVLKGSRYNRDDNFGVSVNYHGDRDLETGCNDYLKLIEFYEQHNVELAGMYRQMMILASKARFYYKNFNIDKSFLRPTPMMVLGFNLNESNAGKYMLFKFKNDMYMQMMNGEVKKLFT